jgi:hypothetical protein
LSKGFFCSRSADDQDFNSHSVYLLTCATDRNGH